LRLQLGMLTTVKAGPYTVTGISVGGVYTSLQVPELGVVLDVGAAPRSFPSTDHLCLSHGHADHAGALATFLGIRALMGKTRPLRVYLPAQTEEPLRETLAALSRLMRHPLPVDLVPMTPGSEQQLRPDLWVRAFRTHHPVPSLGFLFFRRVDKLREEFLDLPGAEIGRRRQAGEDLFDTVERLELAYATDTLARVLDSAPEILRARVLVLECTFLDQRKSLELAHAGCHIHLDEILEAADRFDNEHLVLMHFSQIYRPDEVHAILRRRCPARLWERIIPFAPADGEWPG
jgi:ribonuclease Z